MEVIELKNEYGETILVKRGPRGNLLVSHSDTSAWGQFGEIAEGEFNFAGRTLAAAFLLIGSEQFLLNDEEVKLIREAGRQLKRPRSV